MYIRSCRPVLRVPGGFTILFLNFPFVTAVHTFYLDFFTPDVTGNKTEWSNCGGTNNGFSNSKALFLVR